MDQQLFLYLSSRPPWFSSPPRVAPLTLFIPSSRLSVHEPPIVPVCRRHGSRELSVAHDDLSSFFFFFFACSDFFGDSVLAKEHEEDSAAVVRGVRARNGTVEDRKLPGGPSGLGFPFLTWLLCCLRMSLLQTVAVLSWIWKFTGRRRRRSFEQIPILLNVQIYIILLLLAL